MVKGVGFVTYHYDNITRTWWSKDATGHGESAWKVHEKNGDWRADADVYGDYMIGKHKGETGKKIDFKSLKCGS